MQIQGGGNPILRIGKANFQGGGKSIPRGGRKHPLALPPEINPDNKIARSTYQEMCVDVIYYWIPPESLAVQSHLSPRDWGVACETTTY
jgi:hypothetical protein